MCLKINLDYSIKKLQKLLQDQNNFYKDHYDRNRLHFLKLNYFSCLKT